MLRKPIDQFQDRGNPRCGPVATVLLAMLVSLSLTPGSASANPQQSPEMLGQLLGVARGCDDKTAAKPLTACLMRFAKDAAVRKRLIAAADKAQRSPWLERPGVCSRAKIAVRELALWKGLCRDLGPPPY